VRAYKLTKQAFKVLKLLSKNDLKIAKKIKGIINDLRSDAISGESLQGYRQFKKIRAGKYRLIYSYGYAFKTGQLGSPRVLTVVLLS